MPRTIPMIASLLDEISGGRTKPGRVYVVLWAYEFGDGFVDLPDPARLALEAGYTTNRAERTLIERFVELRNFGFIRSAALGTREFGHILLLDPHRAVASLRAAQPERAAQLYECQAEARQASVSGRTRLRHL